MRGRMGGRGISLAAAADGDQAGADGEGVAIFFIPDGHSAVWFGLNVVRAAWNLGIAASFWRVFVRGTCHFWPGNVIF